MVLQLGHRDDVIALAYAPNGSIFATLAREMDTGYSEVKLWDGHSGQLTRTLSGPFRQATSLAFSPDSRTLAIGGSADASSMSLWQVASGRLLRRLSAKYPHAKGKAKGAPISVASVVYTPDGKSLITGGGYAEQSGQVCLWDAASGLLRAELAPHDPDNNRGPGATLAAPALSLSRDGRILAVPTPYAVRIWSLATRKLLRTLPATGLGVSAVVLSPDGQRAVVSDSSGALKVWSTRTGRVQKDLSIKDGSVLSLALSPDGQVLMAGLYGGGGEGMVRSWSLRDGRVFGTRPVANSNVAALAFAPGGQRLAIAASAATVINAVGFLHVGVWDIAQSRWRQRPLEPVEEVLCLAFSADGRQLWSSHSDGTLRGWDMKLGHLVRTLNKHTGAVTALAISPDGKWLVSSSQDDDSIMWWDAASGRLRHTFTRGRFATDLAFSPDSKWLLSSHSDKKARLFASANFQVQREWTETEHGATQVAFAPDGRHLVVAGSASNSRRKNISIRDAASGGLQQEWGARAHPVQMEYSPDGRFLIMRDSGETVNVVDVATGQQKWQVLNQSGFALSPPPAPVALLTGRQDGGTASSTASPPTPTPATVICRGRDGWVQEREITTGRVLRGWPTAVGGLRHIGIVDDYDAWVAVAAGGKWVAGKSDDGSIKLWGAAAQQVQKQLHASLMVTPSAKPIDITEDISPDWIAYTPEGFYNSSAGAEKFVRWRQGAQMHPASVFQKMFRKADRVSAALHPQPKPALP